MLHYPGERMYYINELWGGVICSLKSLSGENFGFGMY